MMDFGCLDGCLGCDGLGRQKKRRRLGASDFFGCLLLWEELEEAFVWRGRWVSYCSY